MRAIISFVTGSRTSWITLAACVVAIGLALALLPQSSGTSAGTGLPASAESARVTALLARFPRPENQYAVVVWSRHDDGHLTAADNAAIASRVTALATLSAGSTRLHAEPAPDRTAILLKVPLAQTTTVPAALAGRIRGSASQGLPSDLDAQVTGTVAETISPTPAGGSDLALVLISVFAALVLLLGSRRPVLWLAQLVVLGGAGWVAIRIAQAVYAGFGASWSVSTRDLVLGLIAALGTASCVPLVVSLSSARRSGRDVRDAVRSALAWVAPTIGAAAIAIAIAMLALLFATGAATRAFGLATAIDVVVLGVLVLGALPALLVVIGPPLVWPSGGAQSDAAPPLPRRVTMTDRRRSMLVAASAAALVCLVVLDVVDAQLGSGILAITPSGARAQKTIDSAFGTGYGNQAIMLVPNSFAGETSTIAPTTLAMNFETVHSVTRAGSYRDRTELIVGLNADPGSSQALQTVREIRSSIAKTGGLTAESLVGGGDATEVDQLAAVSADRGTILAIGIGALAVLAIGLAGILSGVRRRRRPGSQAGHSTAQSRSNP